MALPWCKIAGVSGCPSTKKNDMSLQDLLEPARLLQTIALAISTFNFVAFLWLALTVWLNGNRHAWITRLGVVGLSLSALFFFIHVVLIATPLPPVDTTSLTTLDFLWHLLWLPALGVPYIWFAIGLHYAALINARWRYRRPFLLATGAVLGCLVLLLLIFNQSTITFVGTLRLLAYGDSLDYTHSGLLSSLVLLPTFFLFYVTFCAIGLWFTPGRLGRLLQVLWTTCVERLVNRDARGTTARNGLLLHQVLAKAFWDDPADVELLEEPILSWLLARPRLLLAALLMVCLTITLGMLGIHSMLNWLAIEQHHPLPVPPVLTTIPFNLIVLDLIANGAVAFIILLIGYSIIRHGVLIERPLARRGFVVQWRGIVIVDTTVAVFIALLVTSTRSNLEGLLLITALATVAYAMFTWSSYTAHDRYIALLGPFLRSTDLRHWLNTDLQKTEQGLQDLFFHLCQDALAVRCARLTIIAGPVRRSFSYRWPEHVSIAEKQHTETAQPGDAEMLAVDRRRRNSLDRAGWTEFLAARRKALTGREAVVMHAHRLRMSVDEQPMICWVLPMYDERGLAATLYLGPRQDGGAFTDEDMDLAHACGQRILDTLGDHEAMQAVAGLLRSRIVDVKLLGAQQRRVLHDEILPQMHLALLRLETLRPALAEDDQHATTARSAAALDEAVATISDAHRRLAAMMRATTSGAPHRLERDGMIHAIRTMIELDFRQAFDEVRWDVTSETARYIDDNVPPAIAELIFAAVQEALRNAARHGRGSDVHRHLSVTVRASCNPHLEVLVTDDGVGIVSTSSTTGTGGGLLTHSALL